jgi:hypothetical protein
MSLVLTDRSEHKGYCARSASPEQLIRATLDQQAEIFRLKVIHKYMADAFMTM